MGITAFGGGYLYSRKKLNERFEIIPISTWDLWKFRWFEFFEQYYDYVVIIYV